MQYKQTALLTRFLAVGTCAMTLIALSACSSGGGGGASAAPSGGGTINIGLIDDLTGSSGLFGKPTNDVAELAVSQINATGGVDGHHVVLVTADGATDPATSQADAQRLVSQNHISALFGMFSSAQSNAVLPVAKKGGVPYFYTPIWQGEACDADMFANGEVPAQQLAPVIPWVQKTSGKSKWFLLGDNYVWPQVSFALAKKYIAAAGGTVVGTQYVPLGTTDYTAVISKIKSSGANIMIPALVGSDAVAFEKQAFADGLGNAEVQRLALLYEDNTRAAMGAAVTDGMYFSTGYDQVMDNSTNKAFLDAYHAKFGTSAPPMQTLSEHAYVAIKAWAQAANDAKSLKLPGLTKALDGMKLQTPGGTVTYLTNHYVTQSIAVDHIQADGKAQIVKSFGEVAPDQTCTF